MKKLLALVLALVMTMSLVTISNAAFTDADEIDYAEAVDVMNAVGVLAGMPDGSFAPKAELTRAQACKIIAYLDLGEDIAEALPALGVFTDVPADHWAAKYVAYCADAGYVSGVGNGKFDPDGKLSGYAFGKMLLCVLGYDAEYEQFTGSSWEISVAKKMKSLELADGVDKLGSAALTREEAAQYALNALETITVTANKGTTTKVEGVTVVTGGSAATKNPVATGGVTYTTASDGWLQLCESLYGNDLQYRSSSITDDFGRTAHEWFWKGTASKDKIGTYADKADYTFVVSSTKDTPNVLAIIEELGVDATSTNKQTFKSQTVQVGDTVEIFTDTNGKATSAIIFETQLAKVTKVAAASKDAEYDYTVTLKTSSATKSYKDTALVGFDANTMTKDTYVTYTSVSGQPGVMVAVAEKVTGKVTGYKASDYFKVDGTKHTTSSNLYAVDNATSDNTNTFDFYLDANGYVIGTVKVTDINTVENIFYVADANFYAGTNFADKKAQLKVYYLDGTTKVIDMVIDSDSKVDLGASTKTALPTPASNLSVPGKFYAYTTDGDEISKITAVVDDSTVKNTYSNVTDNATVKFTAKDPVVEIAGTNYYASNDTKIVIIDKDGKASTITGYSKLPTKTYTIEATFNSIGSGEFAGVLFVADKSNLKELYIVAAYERVGAVDTDVYGYFVKKGDVNYDADEKAYVTDVVFNVDGTDTTYKMKSTSSYEGIYLLTVDDGFLTVSNSDSAINANKTIDSVGDGFIVVNGIVVKLADDCAIYDATDVKAIAAGDLNDGDIVNYTVNGEGEINRIYVAYAAQDDGIVDVDDSAAFEAYLQTIGFSSSTASSLVALDNAIVAKYTADAAVSGTLSAVVTDTDTDNVVANWSDLGTVSYVKDETHGIGIDLDTDFGNGGLSGGSTPFPVGNYEIVIKVGSTELATYTFSVGA